MPSFNFSKCPIRANIQYEYGKPGMDTAAEGRK
jgi:hypothetical protein